MTPQDDRSCCHDPSHCVSVIIPTRDSAKTIAQCLQSIVAQTYKNVEILIIDGFSTDATIDIVLRFKSYVYSIRGERTKAKNFGISKAKGDLLLFIDSDMILQPQVIEDCVKTCSTDITIAGVVIPERSMGNGFWVKVRDFERSMYAGSRVESARFFKKEFVEKVGGFDEEIISYEEATLPQKIENLGMIVNARITSLILHNEEEFNLRKWLRKKRYYSETARLYSTKYSNMPTSIRYRFNVFVTLNGNWKKLIRHPLLSIGTLILKFLEFLSSVRI